MLLARLSAPRPLGPDMERWFRQDRSRISRFIKKASQFIYDRFHHTLCFDGDRLREDLVGYAARVAMSVGLEDDADIEQFNIGMFGDGKFWHVAEPIDG